MDGQAEKSSEQRIVRQLDVLSNKLIDAETDLRLSTDIDETGYLHRRIKELEARLEKVQSKDYYDACVREFETLLERSTAEDLQSIAKVWKSTWPEMPDTWGTLSSSVGPPEVFSEPAVWVAPDMPPSLEPGSKLGSA